MRRLALLVVIIFAAVGWLIGFYRSQSQDPLLTGDPSTYAGTWSVMVTAHGVIAVPPVRPGTTSQPLPAVGTVWTAVQAERGVPDLLTAPNSAQPIAWYWQGGGDVHLRLDLSRAADGSLRVAAATTMGDPAPSEAPQ